jgi:ABC-2 type transport system permease protein
MRTLRRSIRRWYKGISDNLKAVLSFTLKEYKHLLHDPGVLVLFVAASLFYPLLYCSIYRNEILTDVPIAVVDNSHTVRSRDLLRQIDATPELKVVYQFNTLQEAKNAFDQRKIHGIIYVPADFSYKINRNEQATVSMYSDMSSFLYFRAMMMASNYTVLKVSSNIKIERLNALGITGESAVASATPLPHEENILYNKGTGFASFLMPAILILIIHQTLFFGIGMLAGTAREENIFHSLIPVNGSNHGIIKVITGKSLCYFSLYFVLSTYILGFIPRLFNLPHIGNPADIIGLMVPFLLATIFFSMTVSVFIRNRETGLVVFLFFSLILLFLSGFSWPRSNMNGFWLAFSWIFPSTHGIQAYIKINTMGATMKHIRLEYINLWAQVGFYFLTTVMVYRWQIMNSRKLLLKESNSEPLIINYQL